MTTSKARTGLTTRAALAALLLAASATASFSESAEAPETAARAPQASAALPDGVRDALSKIVTASTDAERADSAAAIAFYEKRAFQPMWVTDAGATEKAKAIASELADAASYGLDPRLLAVPDLTSAPAELEARLTLSALAYARHARGGRIPDPAGMLNSNLDRKPQLIAASVVLDGLAAAAEPNVYIRGLQPKHPQFEKLRQAYLAALPKPRSDGQPAPLNAAAKRLRANMEMWRWMWDDLGRLHVFNNIPEFMQRVYLDGAVIRSEKIVAGRVDKQSSIFSRPLKYVVLRPQWRVPESIMVHELWPSLLRGGGYMRQYGLNITTKSGEPRDWRAIDWSKDDIRNYHVWQPPGPKSVLGYVKFSFPSQHTIFMHDTPDKWMFRSAQRTLSHGCLRVQKPMELAEIILREDKGWDAAKVAELSRSGPLNNEIEMTTKIPIHLAYFTAWVEDDGRMRAFPDIYGHERRVTQALDGQWDKIDKGRDHLAPVQPQFNPAVAAQQKSGAQTRRRKEATVGDMIGDALGLSF
ncbi:MAG: L,D-transpeptidase family protein [Hyphomicrobium sp.]